MPGGHEYRHISATDNAHIINGDIHNNYTNARVNHGDTYNTYVDTQRPKPPTDGSYERGLIGAAKSGSMERIQRYLKFDIKVDFADDRGWTALHWAARIGHEDIAQALLEAHCDIDYRSHEHGTPLNQAVHAQKSDMVRFLLSQGANPNATSRQHGSALHEACEIGNLEIVNSILASGANVDPFCILHTAETGVSSQYIACMPLYSAIKHGHAETVSRLLASGADVEALYARPCEKFPSGFETWRKVPHNLNNVSWIRQAIHVACFYGHDAILDMLIRSGAFVDARSSPTGLTPLSYAATFGHMECIRVLLAHGASTNIKAVGGDAPLHLAAQKGHLESLKLLLDKGAARDDTTSSGCTALHCAVSGGWKECVEILLASGASTNIRNHYGDLASHIAARQGHLECLKCLLNGNKNNLLDGRGRRGCTPLMVAISNGHTTCAELLLGKGADPSLAEDRGRSAIHFARDEACVRILARHDTSMMTLQDHVGSTLLMISAAHGRQAVVQKLLDLEAPMIHQTDRKGFNAFDHAKGQEHKGIVELLTRHGARPTSRATRPLSNDTILHTSSGATQHKVSLGLTTSQRNPSIYTRRLAYYSPPLYTYRSTRQVYSTESETAPMK